MDELTVVKRLVVGVAARWPSSAGGRRAVRRSSTSPPWYERLRYPLRYSAIVRVHARENGPRPGAARRRDLPGVEVRGRRAVGSGAIGLMQLTPSTAHGIAMRTGGIAFRTSDLYEPGDQHPLRRLVPRNLFDKYGNERLVLAAYNAGQGNVDRWRASGEPIQFAETRAYVDAGRAPEAGLPARRGASQLYAAMIDPVLELAENANTYTPLGPATSGSSPTATSSGWAAATTRLERRAALPLRRRRARRGARGDPRAPAGAGPDACTWEVGSYATPADLVDRLLALGLVDDDEPLRGRDGADRAAGAAPPADVEVRRVETRRGRARRGADRGGRVRHGRAGAAAARPGRTASSVPRLRRRRAGRAGDRRRSASMASRSSAARRCRRRAAAAPTARSSHARWEDAVARGTPVLVTQAGAHVAADPRAARLPRGVRDPHPRSTAFGADRSAQPAEWARARLGEGRLRDPRGGRAGRRGRRAGQGRPDRAGAGDPDQVPREHPGRPAQRRPRRAASAARRAATGSRGRPTRSPSPR